MKITVVGAGAMGSLFGGRLSKVDGNQVTLVDTWAEHVDQINSTGLEIKRGQESEIIKIKAVLPAQATEVADLVIVFTKSQHTESALAAVKSIFNTKTLALSLQNGLGNVERLSKYLPLQQIMVGTTTLPSDVVAPGVIRSEGEGDIKMLDADGIRRPQSDHLAEKLNEAGLPCAVVEDVFVSIWEKVAFNAAMNALCAVTRLPVGGFGDTEEGVRLAMKIAEESIAVANKKGIKADINHCRAMINKAFAEHKHHKASMLQDVIAKRSTEISAINGAIAAEAAKLNMQVPVVSTLADLVTIIEKNYHSKYRAEE